MSIEGLVVTVTLMVIVILWVGAPLLRRGTTQQKHNKATAGQSGQQQLDRLLTDYARVLNNLRDLDEDHATGKIQTETYEQEREQAVQRGVQLLMAIDKLEGARKPAKHEKHVKPEVTPIAAPAVHLDSADGNVDDAIEAAILARRKKAKSHAG
ncbi:MAG: hypothetical protein IT324_18730 [Anaerolineae bacterium]|nr:hypothetical protein [Anaerolineae bacterium]